MQQAEQFSGSTVSSGSDRLQAEADALITSIILQKMSDKNIQRRTLLIAGTALQNNGHQGKVKTWLTKKLLALLPDIFQTINNNSDRDDTSLASALGRFLTVQMRIKNQAAESTTFHRADRRADDTAAFMDDFLSNIDFGELYEMVSGSHDDVRLLARTLSDMLLEQHTGKLAALLPSIVEAVNLLVEALNIVLDHKKDLPPDFVADFIAGLINLLDGKALGTLLDQKNELVRLLNTGGLLQGDGHVSLFQQAVSVKTAETISGINPDLYFKMMTARAGLKESIQAGMLEGIETSPEIIGKVIVSKAQTGNSQVRILKRKIKLLLNLSEQDLQENITCLINDIDADEISELADLTISLAANVLKSKPGLVEEILSNIISGIDTDAFEDTFARLTKEIFVAINPFVSVLMPSLVNGLVELLSESLNQNTDQLPSALLRLSNILKTVRRE